MECCFILELPETENTCINKDVLLVSLTPEICISFWQGLWFPLELNSCDFQKRQFSFIFPEVKRTTDFRNRSKPQLTEAPTKIAIVNVLPLRAWTTISAWFSGFSPIRKIPLHQVLWQIKWKSDFQTSWLISDIVFNSSLSRKCLSCSFLYNDLTCRKI